MNTAASHTPPLILLVEDELLNQEMMQALLELEGYRVLVAARGDEALRLVEHQKPALILLDARMPGMSGYEVCEILKTQSDTRHIPIVMLTALESEEDRQAAIEAGVDYFMTKSVDHQVLLSRIRTLLEMQDTSGTANG